MQSTNSNLYKVLLTQSSLKNGTFELIKKRYECLRRKNYIKRKET